MVSFLFKKKFAFSSLYELLQNIVILFLTLIINNQSDSEGEDTNRNNPDDNAVIARRNTKE